MLQERRNEIIEKIKVNGMVKVADLVKEYGVSIETIRRDLEYLESAGHLKRVYGGAVPQELYGKKPTYNYREVVNAKEKQAIGQTAANLVEDGDTLLVDVGATALAVVQNLYNKNNLTIITNASRIASEAVQLNNCRVILLGGEMRAGELSVSGHLAEQNLGNFYANKLIMGLGGITIRNGVTDYHYAEANVRRLMLERSDQIIAVADHSKFGVTATNFICSIDRVTKLVTDWKTPLEAVENLRAGGVDVYVSSEKVNI